MLAAVEERIAFQLTTLPHSDRNSKPLFPPPLLMLPAPRIAGLLTAWVASSEPPPPLPEAEPFIYNNPRMVDLPEAKRERLLYVTRILLDASVDVELGSLSPAIFHAAAVLLKRAVIGQSSYPPSNRIAFLAEIDADVLDMSMRAREDMKNARKKAEERLEEMLARARAGTL